MELKSYRPYDEVKLCKDNICIEARGQNAKKLIAAISISLLLLGIAAVVKATR